MGFGGGSEHGLYREPRLTGGLRRPPALRADRDFAVRDQAFGSSRNCGIFRVVFFWYSA
jgi:hypothetical protein